MDKKIKKKGEMTMNACALKPVMPFVSRNKLERTPATEENKKMVEFMDSHDFFFHIDAETEDLECTVTGKGNEY